MRKNHLVLLQVIVAFIAIACFPAKTAAQTYRGFFTIEPVAEFWKIPYSENYASTGQYEEKMSVYVAPAIATIHGVQWRKLYFGLGAEALLAFSTRGDQFSKKEIIEGGDDRYYGGSVTDLWSVPVFACVRYDLFGSSNTNFYAEVRGGASIAFQTGWFGQLTIGGRKRMKKDSGINYGIIFRMRPIDVWSTLTPDSTSWEPYNVHTKLNAFGVGLMLGFDF